ncbi:MAG: hypothetical protein GX608_00210, partial [Lentisphaerae bacterium]|nr:hypothetical protein [Lentisphaerota bacterium]
DVNLSDDLGLTALHFAAMKGQKSLVALLIAKGADINARDNNEQSPYDWAAVKGRKETADQLIRAGYKGK